ncbi:Ldh family oxidoreductase [Sulfuracidifex metallicus]|nr:Ldh family oxidoreductase [Sulfuracidifex metallicus]WOE49959.1 Ldh family oxidoreductase [Sulfuracidifex metallicus DSM 6482 = JCM 9184]
MKKSKVKIDELKGIMLDSLKRRGVQGADVIVNHFLEAELKGHSSHGVQRMIPLLKGLDVGTIRREISFSVERETNSSLYIDGNRSIGIVLWDLLIKRVTNSDVFLISVRNASHIGYLGYYTSRLASIGVMSIMFGNAEPSVVMPGTTKKVLSTSPISIGIPPDLVLDMSLASTSRGKIVEAKRKGEKIPLGWAVDEEGKETDQPERALMGGILPLGGRKGFYLSLFLDMLTSSISGSEIAENVVGVLNTSKPPNKGEVLIEVKYYHQVKLPHIEGEMPGKHGEKIMKEAIKSNLLEVDEFLMEELRKLA